MQPTSILKKNTTTTQKIKQNKKTATVTPYPRQANDDESNTFRSDLRDFAI